jgi:hypothetical protein
MITSPDRSQILLFITVPDEKRLKGKNHPYFRFWPSGVRPAMLKA